MTKKFKPVFVPEDQKPIMAADAEKALEELLFNEDPAAQSMGRLMATGIEDLLDNFVKAELERPENSRSLSLALTNICAFSALFVSKVSYSFGMSEEETRAAIINIVSHVLQTTFKSMNTLLPREEVEDDALQEPV